MKYLKDQQGFSLIQAMIAVGILAVIGLAMTNLVVSVFSRQVVIEKRSATSANTELLKIALAKPDICRENLQSFTINLNSPESTKDFEIENVFGLDENGGLNGKPLFSVHEGGRDLRAVRLSNIRRLCPVSREFVAEVQLMTSIGSQERVQIFTIYLVTDTSGRVSRCSTVANNVADALCI